MNEYKQLSTAAENLLANSFQVPAVAVAIVTALAISGKVDTHYFGFGVLIGVFLLSIWLGYYNSTLNRYWLQLVRIEKKVNSTLDKNSPERLTYYSNVLGKERTGAKVYSLLLALLIVVSFAYSLIHVWDITSSWIARALSVVLALLTAASFTCLRITESMFRTQKEEILDPDSDSGDSNKGSIDTKT